jgi:hypothetical protein
MDEMTITSSDGRTGLIQMSDRTSFVAAEIRHGLRSAASAAADRTAIFNSRASRAEEKSSMKLAS